MSWATEALTKVETAISGTLDRRVESYVIFGRQISSFSPQELLDVRQQLKQIVQHEDTGNELPVVYGVAEPMRDTNT